MSGLRLERILEGAVTTTPGFEAASVACGIRSTGAPDLALVFSRRPCVGAALFTTNAFKAAPVLYDRAVLARNANAFHGVVINAGCANACTGAQGLRDSQATAAAAGAALGVSGESILVMSTGVIGVHLPMDKVLSGVKQAASSLDPGIEAGHATARAIMTTDTRPKESAVRVLTPGAAYTIAGMAKGAGMIHPNMATMLCVLTTDARLTPDVAHAALTQATEVSLNAVTVDGDMSTNDTVLLLANGQADVPLMDAASGSRYAAFVEGLMAVATDLAKELARDGEGATRLVEVTVRGARSRAEAKQAAKSVANSLLVKTAIYGQDANWGRIACAVGYSGIEVDPERVNIWLGDLELFRLGAPYDVNEARASEILAQKEIAITVDLGAGDAQATVWTCDLSHGYVDINAHYRT